MSVKDLIPKDKYDVSNIDKLYSLTDDEIEPIIYDLLEWIQDYNWPVAQKLVPVLKKREDIIFPYVIDILRGDDSMWKYWIMDLFIPDFSFEHKNVLKDDILKMINDSDDDEDTESIREIAIECYRNCGF
jgi:hypothetical protein